MSWISCAARQRVNLIMNAIKYAIFNWFILLRIDEFKRNLTNCYGCARLKISQPANQPKTWHGIDVQCACMMIYVQQFTKNLYCRSNQWKSKVSTSENCIPSHAYWWIIKLCHTLNVRKVWKVPSTLEFHSIENFHRFQFSLLLRWKILIRRLLYYVSLCNYMFCDFIPT